MYFSHSLTIHGYLPFYEEVALSSDEKPLSICNALRGEWGQGLFYPICIRLLIFVVTQNVFIFIKMYLMIGIVQYNN